MNIELYRLLFDFGLVVLIWMVQLIIYPSFLGYTKENLIQWHKIYVKRISYVVIPLMFGQLISSSIQVYLQLSLFTIISFILVMLAWILTFSIFVPLHNKISTAIFDTIDLHKLVKLNWWRTFVWTAVFLWSLLKYYLYLNLLGTATY